MRFYPVYYCFRGAIPRSLQLALRRAFVLAKRLVSRRRWPIRRTANRRPAKFPGWPEGKQFALVLRHDIESQFGHDRCHRLVSLECGLGFRSAFFFVPQDYCVSPESRACIYAAGSEVAVHGLKHDGKLYTSRETFAKKSARINDYLRLWGAVGFASPSSHHRLEWLHDLNILYDSSTFDTDPFEPQPDGVGTIYPFVVTAPTGARRFVELPYTLPQDFTVFVLMRLRTIAMWKQKIEWIARSGGMVLVDTHPDYMRFPGESHWPESYPVDLYREFLEHILTRYRGQYWNGLPREVARFWLEYCGR